MTTALHVYERALAECCQTRVRFEDGSHLAMPVRRYLGAADDGDLMLLDGITGPVLDVGCGPGRHLRALTAMGVEALGVDISPVAVELVRRHGAHAVVGDVFGEVPGAGYWMTALLLDGNIGIGGHPAVLLRRLGVLLAPGGTALVELEDPEMATHTARARLEIADQSSGWFAWARVSIAEVERLAAAADMTVEDRWRCGDRWFACLRSAPAD